jgi:hypothetical protein
MNRGAIVRLAIVVALAYSLFAIASPTQAADGPDLQIAYVGDHQRTSGQDAIFRVTNIGNKPVGRDFVVRVTMNNLGTITRQDFHAPDLAPGSSLDSHMRLPDPCYYVTLQAVADPDNLIPETNEANNASGEQFECTVNRGRYHFETPTPSKNHSATLAPTNLRTLGKSVRTSDIGINYVPPIPPNGVAVGYFNWFSDGGILASSKDDSVYQSAIKFDLSQIHGTVEQATLLYTDSPNALLNGDGQYDPGPGPGPRTCANALGLPSVYWLDGYDGLLPNDNANVGDSSRPGSWDVANVVEHWVVYGDNNGFVLRGDNESFPDNNAACLTGVSNIRLVVNWVEP